MMETFLFANASRPVLGPTQIPIQLVAWAVIAGVRWPGREADHSPLSSYEVKNVLSYNFTPEYIFTAWYLVKYRGNFAFKLPSYKIITLSEMSSFPVNFSLPDIHLT